ncbi:unnamed protein product [Adineta steineri]|uniref:Caspase family p20 domain-containing protein n=1 Tax=Adineta steineri TaxID=433720 RepID=A0A819HZU6_9BILA|nr:unnamed protein product [Adineta steineri]CAF3908144.1 unnamed protein product [Adineta steineri]
MASSVSYKRKIGLVIGINKYPRDVLQYCINDANDLANTLQRIGFQISLGLDCNLSEFLKKIDTFIKTIERDDLVLFYFAGHGKQNEDENYLLPSDYNYDYSGHERDYIVNNAINVKYIMNKIEDKKSRITIYLFDCCRFKIRTRDPDNKQGLSSINAPAQTLVVFACAPGKAVLDETQNNKNGSFIENLLKHISTSNEHIEEVMRNVADDVHRQTEGFQLPHRTSSLTGKVYLVTYNNQASERESLPRRSIGLLHNSRSSDLYKQRQKSPRGNLDRVRRSSRRRSSRERESLPRISIESTDPFRSSNLFNPRPKYPHDNLGRGRRSSRKRESLPRRSTESLHNSRSSDLFNRRLESARNNADRGRRSSRERESSSRKSTESLHNSRSSDLFNRRLESARNNVDRGRRSSRERQSSSRRSTESPNPYRSSDLFNRRPEPTRNNVDRGRRSSRERESLPRRSGESPHHSRSVATSLIDTRSSDLYDQRRKSSRLNNEPGSPLTSNRDLSAKRPSDSVHHSRLAATSLTDIRSSNLYNQQSRSARLNNDQTSPLTNNRDVSARMPPESSIHRGTRRKIFQPQDSIQLLIETTFESQILCAFACNQQPSCHAFDSDSASERCRLFEGDLTTGSIVSSTSATSIVGIIELFPSLFVKTHNQSCETCQDSRYEICSPTTNTCQCRSNSYWDGSICALQLFTNNTCSQINSCRKGQNLTCVVDSNGQFNRCALSTYSHI